MYKKIKYGILVFLFVYTLIINLKYGDYSNDYCSGITNVILFYFMTAFFIIVFLVFLIIDLILTLKLKKKFDFVPVLLLIVFVSVNFSLFSATNNNYWKSVSMEGKLEDRDKIGTLILFTDYTFKAQNIKYEYYCAHQGKYHIENDTLILDYIGIEDKTESYFTTKYLISDSILQPVNLNFSRIKLR